MAAIGRSKLNPEEFCRNERRAPAPHEVAHRVIGADRQRDLVPEFYPLPGKSKSISIIWALW